MSQDEKDIELIDKYVKGELSGDALAGFEQRLATDITFAEQVEWHEKLVGGIKKQSQKELKDYLQSLEEEDVSLHIKSEPKIKFFLSDYWKYSMAAAVTLLIVSAFIFNWLRPSPQDLFVQYYQPYPNVEATIERNDEATGAYTQAFQLYEDGQYAEAAIAFDQLLERYPQTEALNFYAGLTALELNRSDKAIAYFEKVISNPDHKFYQQAVWYASLAALKNEDTTNAKQYLQQLSGETGFYGNKAMQLLDEL